MSKRSLAWSGPALILTGCLVVWAGLDEPRFVRGYLAALGTGGRLALLAIAGVTVWSLANRGRQR